MVCERLAVFLWKLLIIFLFWQKRNGISCSHIITTIKIFWWLKPWQYFFYRFSDVIAQVFLIYFFCFVTRPCQFFEGNIKCPTFRPFLFFYNQVSIIKRI